MALAPVKYFAGDALVGSSLEEKYSYERGVWAVFIEWRTTSHESDPNAKGWSVTTKIGDCIAQDLSENWEPSPSNRTDEWITAHRFTLEEAEILAHRYVVHLRAKLEEHFGGKR